VRLLQEHPSFEIRGSAQAVLVDDPALTPNWPKAHFLALLHVVDKATGRYAHFAYRFQAEPPFQILQISSQLPLKAAFPDAAAASEAFAFASGLVVWQGTVVISYGAGDRDARALVLTLGRLDELFNCGAGVAVP